MLRLWLPYAVAALARNATDLFASPCSASLVVIVASSLSLLPSPRQSLLHRTCWSPHFFAFMK
ncbi:uncharacterized protein DS421_14g458780 [Arachis hypogaea]|nr:uncharacterized protein DS421_14g458780 [Arachis hypogaea]